MQNLKLTIPSINQIQHKAVASQAQKNLMNELRNTMNRDNMLSEASRMMREQQIKYSYK